MWKIPLKEAVLPYGWTGLEDSCAAISPHYKPAWV